jgi:hypothetical protein
MIGTLKKKGIFAEFVWLFVMILLLLIPFFTRARKRTISEKRKRLEALSQESKRQHLEAQKGPSLMELHQKAMSENPSYRAESIKRNGESATVWDEFESAKKVSDSDAYFDRDRDVLGTRSNLTTTNDILEKQSSLNKFVVSGL